MHEAIGLPYGLHSYAELEKARVAPKAQRVVAIIDAPLKEAGGQCSCLPWLRVSHALHSSGESSILHMYMYPNTFYANRHGNGEFANRSPRGQLYILYI